MKVSVTELKSMSEVDSEMTNGVVTWRLVGLWFSSARMVTTFRMVPKKAQKEAMALKLRPVVIMAN